MLGVSIAQPALQHVRQGVVDERRRKNGERVPQDLLVALTVSEGRVLRKSAHGIARVVFHETILEERLRAAPVEPHGRIEQASRHVRRRIAEKLYGEISSILLLLFLSKSRRDERQQKSQSEGAAASRGCAFGVRLLSSDIHAPTESKGTARALLVNKLLYDRKLGAVQESGIC